MPIYEFECETCRTTFEELVRMGTEKLPCPNCGGENVHRLMSMAAFSSGGKMTTTSSHGSGCSSCGSGHCGSCGHH